MNINLENELKEIKERYSRRKGLPLKIDSPLAPYSIMIRQEKERAIARWIKKCGIKPIEDKRILEIGCGIGNNLSLLINLGFSPQNIIGNELLTERTEKARELLPQAVKIVEGNALELDFPAKNFDIVIQSMVFSSILDENFRRELADKMWRWVKPGGGILWYDFIYNNPKNKDVAGIPFSEVKTLFKKGKFVKWKITLAPPLSRIVTKLHPSFYSLFNVFPVLRTHILCWILK